MAFADSDDGRALRESVSGYLARHHPLERARQLYNGDVEFDRPGWTRLATELGLTGLIASEEHGGVDAGFQVLAVALEETGRVLLPDPLLASILATIVLQQVADEHTQAEVLPKLVSGASVGTVAGLDDVWPGRESTTSVRATFLGDAVRLDGNCRYVMHGEIADFVVLVARDEHDAPVTVLVQGSPEGLVRSPLPALDRSRPLATLEFENVPARVLSRSVHLPSMLQRVQDLASIALASEQLGAARVAMEMTVDYAKNREAFGKPIGAFQAIKHKLARVLVAVESAAAGLAVAAAAADAGSSDLSLCASSAKARVSEAFILAASENVQVHGGIGFTWEHDAHMFLKRARASFELLGAPEQHYARIASLVATGAETETELRPTLAV